MGLLRYIVSLPSHQIASIIESMLANIPTITCRCDNVLPTEPHIESQLQVLSTLVSACDAYATLSACVDCISTRQYMNTSRSAWPGNRSRTRLRSWERLAASARRGAKGPPTDTEYVIRVSFCIPSAKPAPIRPERSFALLYVPPTNPWNVCCRASC
jgi:hypothetical protein